MVDAGTVLPKLYLRIPENSELQAAAGRVALRHAQLEHIQRMTVKSIRAAGIEETQEALVPRRQARSTTNPEGI
jgi:hypothetical protein